MNRMTAAALVAAGLSLSACAPERGTLAWCEDMDKTPSGDWSINDAAEYARSCVLRTRESE